jgi:signal transduction histidine kinase
VPLTVRAVTFAVLILLLLPGPLLARAPRNVLFVFDEDKDLPGLAVINRSLQETLRSELESDVEFYSESLNLSQFSAPGYDAVLRDSFRRKYAGTRLDLVVAVMGPSLEFLLRHGDAVFPGVPIVFCGVDPSDLEGRTLPKNVTGVLVKRAFGPTLDIALRLQPDTASVFVVGGTSKFDRHLQAIARRDFKPFERRAVITFLTTLPMDELLTTLSTLPPHSVILYLTLFADGAGRAFIPHEALSLITGAANAPVYVSLDQYLGSGAVGGHVYSLDAHGRQAAEIALRIMRGEPPASIPVIETAAYRDLFDWRQLHRWRLAERRLRAGSVVSFRPPSFWTLYRWYIAAGAGLLVLQTALIVGLLVTHAQRRRAQRILAARLEFETLLSEVSAGFVTAPSLPVDRLIERMLQRLGETLDLDRAALAERKETLRVTHSWTGAGFTPVPTLIEADAFPWIGARLAHGDPVRIGRLDALPEEAARDRRNLGERGIRSLAAVPLVVNGAVVGALGVARLRGERAWPDELLARLQLLADVFANGLARHQAEDAARESDERRRRAEGEAQCQRDQLAHALRVATLGELAASIAHEITQPLTAIMTNANATRRLMAIEQAKPHEISDTLIDIADDARRASQTIHRLRALFRKEPTQRIAVDLNALIDDVLGLLQGDIHGKNIAVRFTRDATLPRVLGDPIQLRQVILNLIVNAADAIAVGADGPREIRVDTSQPLGGRIAVAIRDSGVGVEESELERIFEHFVSTKPQGLGMGLAISRSIVEAHGGRIWATRNDAGGLTLHLELPSDQASALAPDPDTP